MFKNIILTTFLFLLLTTISFSHGGRTNADGCHTNRKTGEYHCHGTKKKSQTNTKQSYGTKPTTGYDCSKKNCNQMSSCMEAKYKLSVCYHYNLDRDSDGIPCEVICGN